MVVTSWQQVTLHGVPLEDYQSRFCPICGGKIMAVNFEQPEIRLSVRGGVAAFVQAREGGYVLLVCSGSHQFPPEQARLIPLSVPDGTWRGYA